MTRHDLRMPWGPGDGTRVVALFEGPHGWGEWSLVPGYPCDPAVARAAALECAESPWPAAVRASVAVNALVDGPGFDPATLAGYPCVKVKVGYPGDLEVVAAVRDAVGPRVAVRIDANGAWDRETAVGRLASLARYSLELAEQPVAGLDDLAWLRRHTPVPVAADECIRTPADARRCRELDAADAVVLKLQPLGGFRAALAVAEEAGVPAVVTSMRETSVGIAAGLALAAALGDLPYACGLATATALTADVTPEPLVPEHGRLALRRVDADPALLVAYEWGSSSQEASA